MKLLDYIFFRVYLYCESYKWEDGRKEAYAVFVAMLIFIMPLAVLIGLAGILPDLPASRIELYPYLLVIGVPFYYRYAECKKITANDYQYFRDKWGNIPAKTCRKHNIIILIVFIVNVILFPLTVLLLQIFDVI